MSQGSFSQTLFGGQTSAGKTGLFVLKDGQFTQVYDTGTDHIVSIAWTYASSTLVYASETSVWTAKFTGDVIGDAAVVLHTSDTSILDVDSPLKAFGKIAAV